MRRKKTKGIKPKQSSQHRKKWKKKAEAESRYLSSDAPVGQYLVDDVARELFLSAGGATGNTTEFIKLVRSKTWYAAKYAEMAVRNQFVHEPRRRSLTKRFLGDLQVIRSRLERNKDLQRSDLSTSFRRPRPPVRPEAAEDEIVYLLATLRNTSASIGNYLDRHELARGGGHYDNHTRAFIQEVFEFWCEYFMAGPPANESRWFVCLLAAGWRDLGFPEDAENGQRLEDWLADRVRKQFRDGIPSARIRHQERLGLRAPEESDQADDRPPDPNLSDELPPDPNL